jgi:hypothetical protein
MNETLRSEFLQMKEYDLRVRHELLDAGKLAVFTAYRERSHEEAIYRATRTGFRCRGFTSFTSACAAAPDC